MKRHSSVGELHLEFPLDHDTIEKFKACKDAQFPICMDRAVTRIFGNKEIMLSVAAKAGFERSSVTSARDVWDLYIKLGDAWGKQMGNSVKAVIESESLKQMEEMGCSKCPLYEIEVERKRKNYTV